MGDFGCGDGGWTMAMKIDGSKVIHRHFDKPFSPRRHFWGRTHVKGAESVVGILGLDPKGDQSGRLKYQLYKAIRLEGAVGVWPIPIIS